MLNLKDKNIHFITYSDKKFMQARERLLKEAKDFIYFKSIQGLGPNDLSEDFKIKFNNILKQSRIAGYGLWRPYIINEKLKDLNEGDYLIYLDAGCKINNKGLYRFNEYIKMLDENNNKYGILSFQMPHIERHWTTKEIFDYFDIDINSEYALSGQYLDGILIMKNNEHLRKIINIWLKAVYDNPEMFTDKFNNNQNYYFKDNRHEQSVFSLIRKKYGSCIIDRDETWMIPFGKGESLNYPFWATRYKK